MKIDFWSVFYAAAAFQGFFLGILFLFQKKGNTVSYRFLSSIILLLAFYLLDIFLAQINFYFQYPHLLYLTIPFWYLLPPLSYFYIRSLLGKKLNYNVLIILHAIPFVLVLIKLFPFYGLPAEIKLKFFTAQFKPPGSSLLNYAFTMLNPIQGSAYFIYILFLIERFSVKKENGEHTLSEAYIKWLKLFVTLMIVFFISLGFLNSYLYFAGLDLSAFSKFTFAVFSIIIYSIAYLAVLKPEEFVPLNIIKKNKTYTKFDGETIERTLKQIDDIMNDEKLYLKPDLKYTELAHKLNFSARQFSQFLNSEIGKSFNDFINEYRVNEVKMKLMNEESNIHTILALALESGFNSKASFNRLFKKHAGQTPSQYLKQIQKNTKNN